VKEWKKVDYFADGVIYACGNEYKVVIPGKPDIYFEVKAQEVRWCRTTGKRNPTGWKEDRLESNTPAC
jgi:hypothetical protein